MDVAIVVLAYDQLDYTRNCLDSLRRASLPDSMVTVVNNGSTDGTAEFLAGRPELKVVSNMPNRGFGFACNQGIKFTASPWVVLLQNDVLVAPSWLEGLVAYAEEGGLDFASPAMREGDLDYDLPAYASEFTRAMSRVARRGVAHAVCLLGRRRVYDAIGLFDDDPRLGGYEDDEFFLRARRAGCRLGTTGRSFIHHFGQVTQKSIVARLKLKGGIGDRAYYRKKYHQTWAMRQKKRYCGQLQSWFWRRTEHWRYGHTLREIRKGGLTEYH